MSDGLPVALGLIFVIEGLFYACFPGVMKGMAEAISPLPNDRLRVIGACAIAVGVAIVWIAKSFAGA